MERNNKEEEVEENEKEKWKSGKITRKKNNKRSRIRRHRGRKWLCNLGSLGLCMAGRLWRLAG